MSDELEFEIRCAVEQVLAPYVREYAHLTPAMGDAIAGDIGRALRHLDYSSQELIEEACGHPLLTNEMPEEILHYFAEARRRLGEDGRAREVDALDQIFKMVVGEVKLGNWDTWEDNVAMFLREMGWTLPRGMEPLP